MEILGIIAIVIGSGAFIWKAPRTVLMLGSVACLFWIVYFATLGQWNATLSSTVGLTSFLAGAFAPDRWMRRWVPLTWLLIIPITWWSYGGPADLFFYAGFVIKGSSLFLRDRPIMFRLAFCGGEANFLLFGLLAGAASTVAWSVIVIGMAVGSATYFHWRDRRRIATSTASPTS